MGHDDANEGTAPGECLEHMWELAGVTLALSDGATRDYRCELCGALLVAVSGEPDPASPTL